jgi:dTDP-4-dehydrorhamnose 3,5-epimerase
MLTSAASSWRRIAGTGIGRRGSTSISSRTTVPDRAKGVLRGFHFQDLSAPMAKLVRCCSGAVLDVVVDLRVGSATFGRSFALELTGENHRQLLVPVGFGHAFLALSEQADVEYKCSGYYDASAQQTIAWNDPEIAAAWPIKIPIVSSKDARGMTLAEYRTHPAFP